MEIIEEIRKFVENECRKPSSKYGYGPYKDHFEPMVSCADDLADELGGDKEIVLLAAWLHDIGSIMESRKNHHVSGAKIAEKKLLEYGYPAERIKLVKKCILNHRSSIDNSRDSLEEQIVAEADVMCNFDNIAGIFEAAYVYEKMDRFQANDVVRKKLENKWNQLHFERSKEIVRPKYEAAMLLLK